MAIGCTARQTYPSRLRSAWSARRGQGGARRHAVERVGPVARLGGEDVLDVRRQRRVGHRLAREDPGIPRADAVPVERRRDVDERDVGDVGGAGIGHGAGDGLVQRRQHHPGPGGCRGRVGLEAGAHEIGAETREPGVVGDLARGGDGLVVVEYRDRPGMGRDGLDGMGQAGADVRQVGRHLRRHRPIGQAVRPEPDAGPEDTAQLVLEAGGEVDVVRSVLQQHEPGGVHRQVGRRQLVTEVPGRLWWDRALPVPGRVVPGVGHRTADGELVAAETAVGGPHGHGEPEGMGHQARVGRRRGALGDGVGGETLLGRQVGIGQPVPVGDGVAEGDGPGRRRRGGRGRPRCCGWPARRRRRPGPPPRRRSRPRRRGSGAPLRPRFAAFPSTDLTCRRRAAAERRPYRLGSVRGQQDQAAVVAAEAEGVGEDGGRPPRAGARRGRS